MQALQPALREFENEGTVFGAINRGQFEKMSLVAPPEEIVAAFDAVASLSDARIRSVTSEINILAALRDTLLPKLMSGEIRVRDAERQLGKVM